MKRIYVGRVRGTRRRIEKTIILGRWKHWSLIDRIWCMSIESIIATYS